jgi:Uma2 family endonuclease
LLSERVGTEGWAVCEKEVVVHTPDGEEQVRVPDICYIRKAKADIIGQDAIRGAPDIVIEILSESTQEVDRFTKRAEYGASGVLEYWVVDIPSRAVLVHDFQRGSRRLFKKSFESGVLKSLGLPCRFSVPEIFENLP